MVKGRKVALVIFGTINTCLLAAGITYGCIAIPDLFPEYTKIASRDAISPMMLVLLTLGIGSALFGYFMLCTDNKYIAIMFMANSFVVILFDAMMIAFSLLYSSNMMDVIWTNWFSSDYDKERHFVETEMKCCGFKTYNQTDCSYTSTYANYSTTCYTELRGSINKICLVVLLTAITFVCIHFVEVCYGVYFSFHHREEAQTSSITMLDNLSPSAISSPPFTAYALNSDIKRSLLN